jgi:putative ABC transport system permease protein
MTNPLGAWRLPLRIARRDALRHRGRSVLTLVMIALPVLAVTTADVLMQTADVSGVESIDRRMGASEALVSVHEGQGRVEQAPDPDEVSGSFGDEGDGASMPTAEQVSEVLGGSRLVEMRLGQSEVRTDKGAVSTELREVDLSDPVTRGLFDLTSGRWPQDAGEAVVNRALVDKGYSVGETLDRPGAGHVDPVIVGIAESTTSRTFPVAAGPVGSFGLDGDLSREWLVDGPPVTWAQVRALNDLGALVASREVITNPPPESEWPEMAQYGSGGDDATVAILVLVVVMALIEVVLLAGPAFAVGARKQQRSLALISATGGTPTQSRRVVIGSAVVLGSLAALLGVGLGIGAARAVMPLVEGRSSSYLGPFDVPWLHLAGVAAFGMLSAFLAAVVPAYLASRQDVVAVLAGRRGDSAPSYKSPVVGVVLVGGGIVGSVVGATGGGEILIAASAIPAVLGMVLLIPLVLAGIGRLGGRLPLVLRYAVRDAARHRTRTVPAVAAVAATVAGVVALGVGLTSDEKENKETYSASLADGFAAITSYGETPSWDAYRAAIEREAPGVEVVDQLGLSERAPDGGFGYSEVTVKGNQPLLTSYGSSLGASVVVSDGSLPPALAGVAPEDADRAERALRSGGLVAFYSGAEPDAETAKVVHHLFDEAGEQLERNAAELPTAFVHLEGSTAGPAAVISSAGAEKLGVTPSLVALVLAKGELTRDQEDAIEEALGGVDTETSFYAEHGYTADDETLIAQLILVGLGGVLMLGGTLTATFLALSDARPDLATLSAVGASPRTRRGVAAAYAVVVGFVGAVLGAVVGFIPGVAVTYPLTSMSGDTCVVEGSGSCTPTGATVGPFLDIPWLMILGLVVALPLLTAAVVGVFARSRLPLVVRLD